MIFIIEKNVIEKVKHYTMVSSGFPMGANLKNMELWSPTPSDPFQPLPQCVPQNTAKIWPKKLVHFLSLPLLTTFYTLNSHIDFLVINQTFVKNEDGSFSSLDKAIHVYSCQGLVLLWTLVKQPFTFVRYFNKIFTQNVSFAKISPA